MCFRVEHLNASHGILFIAVVELSAVVYEDGKYLQEDTMLNYSTSSGFRSTKYHSNIEHFTRTNMREMTQLANCCKLQGDKAHQSSNPTACETLVYLVADSSQGMDRSQTLQAPAHPPLPRLRHWSRAAQHPVTKTLESNDCKSCKSCAKKTKVCDSLWASKIG